MPGLVETPAQDAAPQPEFTVSHQKVNLDIDLVARKLGGHTEIVINPLSADLKHVRLHCRQARITQVKFSPKGVVSTPHTYVDPYSVLKLPYQTNAHQHHLLQDRLEKQFTNPTPELDVTIPKTVKISEVGATIVLDTSRRGVVAHDDSSQAGQTAGDQGSRFSPVTIYIDFVVDYIRDGLHFVGWDPDDLRYPHAYTQNAAPGSMSCLFPCFYSISSRCTWDISIKISRTIGDALQACANLEASECGQRAEEKLRTLSEEEKGFDLLVTCSGDLTDEVCLDKKLRF